MRKRFEPLYGNLIGLDYRVVYCGTATPDPQPPCAAVLSGAPAVSFEGTLPMLDGYYRVASYPLFDAAHHQWGVVSVVQDVTGRIWAESAGSGLGSTFCFTLPIATTRVPSDVLVVEDGAGFA